MQGRWVLWQNQLVLAAAATTAAAGQHAIGSILLHGRYMKTLQSALLFVMQRLLCILMYHFKSSR
jgi:hypothetical protein